MNKLCPYFQKPGYGFDILDGWPGLSSALFMDIHPDFAARLRSRYPGLEICLRVYEEQQHGWLHHSPDKWAARFAAVGPEYAISWTMPVGQDNADLFARFDDWSVRFARAVRQYGIEPVGLCVGTGNFTAAADRVKVSEAFPGICETYSVLGPQDYGWPDLQSQVYWHALRWTAWHDDIKEAFGKDMQFMPMECGLTQAVLPGRPDLGWQSGADGVTDDSYIAAMEWYNERLCLLDYAKRAYVYIFHGYGDWATFDHVNRPRVWQALCDFDAGGPSEQPPSESPPPEEPMTDEITVYDMNGQKQNFQWAVDKYGVAFRRAEVEPGQWAFRLVELREKSGPASLITKVVDVDGKPMANTDVAFYWPDAPDPPEPPTPVYAHDWYRNFVHGLTGGTGDVGPGMGPGAYHGIGEGGPHAVWVRDPDAPSDLCYKLGMLAGTPHDHLDQVLQLMMEEDGNGNGGEPGEERFVAVGEKEWTPGPHNYVRIVATNHSLMDMRGNLRCGGWEIPDPVHPKELHLLPGFEFDCSYTEDEDRVYEASIFYLPTGEVVGGPWEFPFGAGDTGVWDMAVEWREPDGEEPGDGDFAAVLDMMAAAHSAIAYHCEALAQHHETLADCCEDLARLVEET